MSLRLKVIKVQVRDDHITDGVVVSSWQWEKMRDTREVERRGEEGEGEGGGGPEQLLQQRLWEGSPRSW